MWIVPSSIRSRFVLESGCLISELPRPLTQWAVEAASSLTLSAKRSPARFWAIALSRAHWMKRLYSRSLPDLMDDRFVAWWTSSLRACRASRIASLANNAETTTSAASDEAMAQSHTSCASSRKPSPPWCSSKTSQLGLPLAISGSDQLASDYQRWVTESRDRSSLLRQTLAQATNESEYSSSHTAKWATPDCNSSSYSNGQRGPNLREQVTHWSTPLAHNAQGAASNARGGRQRDLVRDAAGWQTPTTDSFRTRGGARKNELGLDNQAKQWTKTCFSPHDQTMAYGMTSSPSIPTSRPRLNPAFVCWLMGIPSLWTNPGVTNLEQLEMARYRLLLRSHLLRLLAKLGLFSKRYV